MASSQSLLAILTKPSLVRSKEFSEAIPLGVNSRPTSRSLSQLRTPWLRMFSRSTRLPTRMLRLL